MVKQGDPPTDDLRCRQNNGKQWRCKNRPMEGRSLCQQHYHLERYHALKALEKRREEASLAKGKRRGDEQAIHMVHQRRKKTLEQSTDVLADEKMSQPSFEYLSSHQLHNVVSRLPTSASHSSSDDDVHVDNSSSEDMDIDFLAREVKLNENSTNHDPAMMPSTTSSLTDSGMKERREPSVVSRLENHASKLSAAIATPLSPTHSESKSLSSSFDHLRSPSAERSEGTNLKSGLKTPPPPDKIILEGAKFIIRGFKKKLMAADSLPPVDVLINMVCGVTSALEGMRIPTSSWVRYSDTLVIHAVKIKELEKTLKEGPVLSLKIKDLEDARCKLAAVRERHYSATAFVEAAENRKKKAIISMLMAKNEVVRLGEQLQLAQEKICETWIDVELANETFSKASGTAEDLTLQIRESEKLVTVLEAQLAVLERNKKLTEKSLKTFRNLLTSDALKLD